MSRFKTNTSFSLLLRSVVKSNRPEVLCEIGVLKNFAKLTEKHLCRSPFFNKNAGLIFYLKKRLRRRCFPVNLAKFLRIPS